MADRAKLAQHACVGDENVEAAEALGERSAQPVDLLAVAEVHGHERRGLSRCALHGVVDLLQAAGGAGDEDEPRALGREAPRDGRADPARGAGDERDPAFETRRRHGGGYPDSASRESCDGGSPTS